MNELSFLKVKLKSLAEEAKIIKFEEKRNKKAREQLYLHRIQVVRTEARATLLAYGFIRKRKYKQLEATGKLPQTIKTRAISILNKYWSEELTDRKTTIDKLVNEWINMPTV